MRYSEIKDKIKILKKHAYHKNVGQSFYSREYKLNHWRMYQAISHYDVAYCRFDLDEYLHFLYEKNMRTMLEYDIENYCNLQKNKV